ncbi:DMATS type aromatic prenyltransferase [Aspergillus ibericus CBS 121593]|uniref:DMATS type aromatic prenyltransferase n=1 Tax=Aspergillus ibericus CBS 121593 TaxID=1448316 RepID=A0A395GR64_9EURO|nr:DMATS type aromatic prenyltransferase [Aspergillus ibericus CBS 121593]RAK97896.1 DMATS type aromatic prenyltransferase [Aspergillus ibericus CBS 121593]
MEHPFEPSPRGKDNFCLDHKPWDIIVKYPTTSNANEISWWQDVGPLFGRLLQTAGYSIAQQYQYLLFARTHIIPSLGPYPQRWPSVMTYTDLPIEMSVNFQDSGPSTVRVGIEPICGLAGTPGDRFDQVATEQLVARLSALGPGMGVLDRVLYHHFVGDFRISEVETTKLTKEVFGPNSVQSMYNIGFDFKETGVATKGYVFLRLKERASGVPMRRLLSESLGRLDVMAGRGDAEAVRQVVEYMEEGGGFNEYTYLAWDFVDAAKSRVKVYGVHGDLKLEKAEEVWTMGGRLKDPANLRGLELVRRLWGLLEDDQEDDQEDEHKDEQEAKTGGLKAGVLMWNYEIRPGCDKPVPKLYLPLLGRNDMLVAKTLEQFFQSLGWTEQARTYVDNVQYLFPDEKLYQCSRLHAWVSFAYTEEAGVYVSVYYHSSLA